MSNSKYRLQDWISDVCASYNGSLPCLNPAETQFSYSQSPLALLLPLDFNPVETQFFYF